MTFSKEHHILLIHFDTIPNYFMMEILGHLCLIPPQTLLEKTGRSSGYLIKDGTTTNRVGESTNKCTNTDCTNKRKNNYANNQRQHKLFLNFVNLWKYTNHFNEGVTGSLAALIVIFIINNISIIVIMLENREFSN